MPLDERGLYAPADFSGLRSRAFDAPCANFGARALRAALRVPKRDKHGRAYLGRDHALLGNGFHPAAEAERLLLDAAEQIGAAHDAIEIDGRHWLRTPINAGADRPKARPQPRRAERNDP